MKKSGGIIPRNFKEGFRSEDLAAFVFNAFGPAVRIIGINDYGIDMICNIAMIDGNMMNIGKTFGVQIKSTGRAKFMFVGRQATEWLLNLEYPLLLAKVNKSTAEISIYSTWMLNFYLHIMADRIPDEYPEIIHFIPDNEEYLKNEDLISGNIHIGKPILRFTLSDLNSVDSIKHYQKVLEEWVDMDMKNYIFRRAGITRMLGFTRWQTNCTEAEFPKTFFHFYYWSTVNVEKARQIFAEAGTIIGLNLKDRNLINEFNQLKDLMTSQFRDNIEATRNQIFFED